MNSKYIVFLFVAILWIPAAAQDSVRMFSAKEVIEIVTRFHPVAKQADIFVEKSKAGVTLARAQFDPYLQNTAARKTFDGTDYYYYNRPQVYIPTWFGIEVNAGLENLSGSRTDPEETKGKTNYIGLNVPLAKNLLMDARRAALQTAKIFRNASVVEKRNILNNLLFDAVNTYWNWVQYYQRYQILSDAVAVNEVRVKMVKTSFLLGERPAIDTTEAQSQLQNLELLKSEAWLGFQNSALDLSVYLWTSSGAPYVLPGDIIPGDITNAKNIAGASLPELQTLLEATMKNHPELLIYDYKLDALGIDRKLKFQELLPQADFKYNQLGKGYSIMKTARAPLFENNFQYGVSFGIPLRLSKGRSEYKMARLKITETKLERTQKSLEVETKVKGYFNELATLKTQVAIQEKNYQNYRILQRAEELRFSAGESSLFLINARESRTLEALQKLQELTVKYYKTENSMLWAAGVLYP